jgi:hypothetical protein
MEEVVLWCGGAFLVTLSVIYLEFNAHLSSMATIAFCSDSPTNPKPDGMAYHFFQQDNDPTHLQAVHLTKKESDGVLHQMTWPPQFPDLNQIEMICDESNRRVKEKQPTSALHMWELHQVG